jgi:hypothetical protein
MLDDGIFLIGSCNELFLAATVLLDDDLPFVGAAFLDLAVLFACFIEIVFG